MEAFLLLERQYNVLYANTSKGKQTKYFGIWITRKVSRQISMNVLSNESNYFLCIHILREMLMFGTYDQVGDTTSCPM